MLQTRAGSSGSSGRGGTSLYGEREEKERGRERERKRESNSSSTQGDAGGDGSGSSDKVAKHRLLSAVVVSLLSIVIVSM